jgi:hypothetical protein
MPIAKYPVKIDAKQIMAPKFVICVTKAKKGELQKCYLTKTSNNENNI